MGQRKLGSGQLTMTSQRHLLKEKQLFRAHVELLQRLLHSDWHYLPSYKKNAIFLTSHVHPVVKVTSHNPAPSRCGQSSPFSLIHPPVFRPTTDKKLRKHHSAPRLELRPLSSVTPSPAPLRDTSSAHFSLNTPRSVHWHPVAIQKSTKSEQLLHSRSHGARYHCELLGPASCKLCTRSLTELHVPPGNTRSLTELHAPPGNARSLIELLVPPGNTRSLTELHVAPGDAATGPLGCPDGVASPWHKCPLCTAQEEQISRNTAMSQTAKPPVTSAVSPV
ncbi:uncharacterized protein LOC106011682, partial [Aplysia californica]|uniref:Uncharacterized protein LOC106011682 n=1 Tax=Aplysia californica TaxID=6500 RepID=A0ABM0ZZ96_APLCA